MGLKTDQTIDGFSVATLADGSEKFVRVVCDTCGVEFSRRWRDYRSSQIRYAHNGKTFCKTCANRQNGRRKLGRAMRSTAKTFKDGQNPRLRDGRFVSSDGYVMVLVGTGVYQREHVLVIERELGRAVDHAAGEVVHHIDLDRSNNRVANLVLLASETLHRRAHASLDAFIPRLVSSGLITYQRDTNTYVAVGKLRELLEQPDGANQQPSGLGDESEGSTTRCESLRDDNAPTSAGQGDEP